MWLADLTQWLDHEIGKKHRKNVKVWHQRCFYNRTDDKGDREDSEKNDATAATTGIHQNDEPKCHKLIAPCTRERLPDSGFYLLTKHDGEWYDGESNLIR